MYDIGFFLLVYTLGNYLLTIYMTTRYSAAQKKNTKERFPNKELKILPNIIPKDIPNPTEISNKLITLYYLSQNNYGTYEYKIAAMPDTDIPYRNLPIEHKIM